MTKLFSLNAKINEVTKVNEMKNEYRNATDIKMKKIIISINIIVNDKKRNEYAKQIRKEDAQVQCLLILLYSSNYNISRFRNRFDKQDLKSFKKLVSSQILL